MSNIYICTICGKEYRRDRPFAGGCCQGCYLYYKNGGTDNEIPPKGKITRDNRGCVVCHICGRAYYRLGSHVKESHEMTISDYKKMFGLNKRSNTTEKSYHEKMVYIGERTGCSKLFVEAGANTKIKAGEKLRLGKEARLQARIEMVERAKRKRESRMVNADIV